MLFFISDGETIRKGMDESEKDSKKATERERETKRDRDREKDRERISVQSFLKFGFYYKFKVKGTSKKGNCCSKPSVDKLLTFFPKINSHTFMSKLRINICCILKKAVLL